MAVFRRDIWRYQLQDALIYWVYIPAAVIGSGLLLDRLLDVRPFLLSSWIFLCAGCLVVLGARLVQLSTVDLARFGGGTPNPRRPPKRLVTEGVFRFCRHPMFLGYDLAALGVVLFWRSPCMLLVSFPLLLLFEVRFLKREEKYLARRYGDAYRLYQEKVGMLLPLFRLGEKQ